MSVLQYLLIPAIFPQTSMDLYDIVFAVFMSSLAQLPMCTGWLQRGTQISNLNSECWNHKMLCPIYLFNFNKWGIYGSLKSREKFSVLLFENHNTLTAWIVKIRRMVMIALKCKTFYSTAGQPCRSLPHATDFSSFQCSLK